LCQGDDPGKQSKALESSADALILDLEDSVAEGQKIEARRISSDFIRSHPDSTTQLYVRVNHMRSGLILDDLTAIVCSGPAGIVLPKCEGTEDVIRLGHCLDALEARESLPPASLRIVAIVTETARGVQRLCEFRAPLPRLTGLMWGGEDLCSDLGGSANRAASDDRYLSVFTHARDMCLISARSAEVSAIDAVYTNFRDTQGLVGECLAHRILGFDAKAAIHPAQLDIINTSFSPSDQEIAWARSVIAAFESRSGVASLSGAMLDKPHFVRAQRILTRSVNDLSNQ
jgi:citrate lyase subunit beta / citryl-CoA lyase